MGSSSSFAVSAFAVERNIVGRDRDGELMCDGELSWGDCCCEAASSADVAVCCSTFDLGDVEKKDVILFAREVDGRRGASVFSDKLGCAEGVVGAAIAKGLRGLRGIVNRELSELIKLGCCQRLESMREGVEHGLWGE